MPPVSRLLKTKIKLYHKFCLNYNILVSIVIVAIITKIIAISNIIVISIIIITILIFKGQGDKSIRSIIYKEFERSAFMMVVIKTIQTPQTLI